MSFARMGLLVRGLAALGAAFAGWLSLGALAAVTPSTADRVAVLPPLWTLVLAVLVGLAAAWLIRAHPSSSLVWLPSLFLALPWLPFAVPAATLLWTGPLATLIWMTIGAAIFRCAAPRLAPIASPLMRVCRPLATHPVRAPAIAALIAAVIYLFAAWQLSVRRPSGDEPHYLVIAESLRHDADLQIENNHRDHEYLSFWRGELKPDFLRRGLNGQIYSIHAPGLPALLLPAYVVFGYAGAMVFLALLSAAGSALAWRLCWRLTGQPAAAWFGWAVAALPVPVLFHATAIFPDGPGAVFVLIGAAALVSASRLTVTRAVLHGAALALLPWLHTRFVLLALALGLCVMARLARSRDYDGRPWAERARLIAAFAAVPVLSAAAWFTYFYVIYGTPDPSAPYGRYTQSALANVPAGLTGLLCDQQFGLLPNAPVYLIALCGLGWLTFRNDARRLAIELAAVIAPYALVAAMYYMWWGGWSAPARFLTVVLPLLALPAALVFAKASTWTTRATAGIALGVTIWFSAVMLLVERGRLAFNDRDGFALWMQWANPGVDLEAGLPSLFQTTWPGALTRAVVWGVVLVLAYVTLRAIERRRSGNDDPTTFSMSVVPSAYAMAVMIGFAIVWQVDGVSGVRPNVGQVALIRDMQARPWLRNGIAIGVPDRIHIQTASRRMPRERPLFFMPRMPAGHYRLIVEAAGTVEGRIDAYIGRSTSPVRTFDLGSHEVFDLILPVAVESLSLRPDDRARRTVTSLSLGLDGRDVDRLPGHVAEQTMRYGDAIVFSTTTNMYLEPGGFWLAPQVDADVLIEPDRPVTTMTLLLRNGPVANHVRLGVESWYRDLSLDAGAEVEVEVPASRGGATPLRIYAAEGFRPSAIDPKNLDHRTLGVWVELRSGRRP